MLGIAITHHTLKLDKSLLPVSCLKDIESDNPVLGRLTPTPSGSETQTMPSHTSLILGLSIRKSYNLKEDLLPIMRVERGSDPPNM